MYTSVTNKNKGARGVKCPFLSASKTILVKKVITSFSQNLMIYTKRNAYFRAK